MESDPAGAMESAPGPAPGPLGPLGSERATPAPVHAAAW